MMFKTCPVQIKAAGESEGLEPGQFEALVSVFDNTDSMGDVVRKGAFTETLEDWSKSGNPIPIYYSHRMDDPDYNIGQVIDAEERDEGLWVRGQLDLDEGGTSKARQVYKLFKGRRLTNFSYAYDVIDGGPIAVKDESGSDTTAYELRKLRVYEVGPTPIGANQATDLLTVKSALERITREAKAGRVLSARNEGSLRDALGAANATVETINSVLAQLERDNQQEQPKSHPGRPVKNEELPLAVKFEEPSATGPVTRYLNLISILRQGDS